MQRVIVTVKRDDETHDLEIANDVQAAALADSIAEALHWDKDTNGTPVHYQIEASVRDITRTLQPNESLQDAGVWDGSWLVLRPARVGTSHTGISSAPQPGAQPGSGPMQGWAPLFPSGTQPQGPAGPPDQADSNAQQKPDSYTWKQLD